MKTFFKWLIDQEYRDDSVGDLAKDILRDVSLPNKKTKNNLFYHIAFESKYDSTVINSFQEAWKEYKIYRTLMKK
jgi:uncharacterized protein YozE (UPF0346 family)